MYAPSFPHYKSTGEVWHKVHPLDLGMPVCRSGRLRAVRISSKLPDGAYYCSVCKSREHFVAALERF